MKKQKLFVCMLSTSLLLPSFPLNNISTAASDEITAPDVSQEDSKSSTPKSSDTSHTEDKADDSKAASSENDDDIEKGSSKTTEPKSKASTHDETASAQKAADNAQEKNTTKPSTNTDTPTSDYDKYTLDFFKPAEQRTNNHRFHSWFSRFFQSSQNETDQAPSTKQETTSNPAPNGSNETFFMNEDTNNQTTPVQPSEDETASQPDTDSDTPAPETDTDNNDVSESSNETQDSNTQNNNADSETSPDVSQDDNDILQQLDEAGSNAADDSATIDKDTQEPSESNPTETPDNDGTDTGTSSESDTTQDTQEDTKAPESESQADDRVLESILDQYSEDAKQSKADYDAQKEKQAQPKTPQQSKSPQASSKQSKENHKNPQLPSQSERKHKQKPAQSFEGDLRRSNLRTTATFQLLPNVSNRSEQSGDFAVNENKATRDFIKSIAKDAHQIGQDEDIYASVMIAQAILESDSGNSSLARAPHYNLFGIKGAYQGQSATFNTLEDSGSSMYQISAQFRSYPSEKESLEDYAALIKNGIDGNPTIYQPTWKSEASSYRAATRHLATTYATDTRYADKLNSLIRHYDLTQFDKQKMPNLSDYQPSTTKSHGDFKPFEETTGNTPYPHGQCTWYVYNRMAQFNQSISGDLGDARNWNNRAERKGYHVSDAPKAHSAVVFEAGQQGADGIYGHVAFVEKVNPDGSIVISESNVQGLGVISYRTIDAQDASELSYIEGQK
ncbi:amidase domain-containing protein [Staphylococcus sp. IVB6181]|uniref:amidase domain-containing protein n=1 Tax=Staphylococcus sp. IVB6181 TaxID=2929481 RepID=UPI0021D0A005|nr:amidase domain-containing protein [Staphylococcus sp. IVB6181]UXV35027.1 amidase domain-containing protein [Staphylococcus sp. IVB6181]